MRPLYAIRVVAALLALLYLQSAWDFIVNHSIAFVAYAPTDALAGVEAAALAALIVQLNKKDQRP